MPLLFQEDEEDRKDQAGEGREMVPLEGLALEQEHRHDREHRQRNDLLDDFQLHEVERAPVVDEADAVRRDLGAILEKGDAPRQEDDPDKRPTVRQFHFLEFEMAVPGQRHETVAENEQQDG